MTSRSNALPMALSGTARPPRRFPVVIAALAILLGLAAGAVSAYVAKPVYVIGAVAGLIFFAAAMVSFEFGLVFVLFLTYTRFSDVVVHSYAAPSVAKVLIGILALAILLRWALFGERPRGIVLPGLLLILYGLVSLASMLYAYDRTAVVLALSDYWKDAAIGLIVVALFRQPRQFRQAVWSLLAVGIFLGALSVHQFVTRNYHSQYSGFAVALYMSISTGVHDYRLAGPVGDPNFFAQVMLVPALLGVERLFHERNLILKLLAGLAAGLSILTVAFTYSRGGLIALVGALVLYFILYPPRPLQLILFTAFALIMLAFIPGSYYDRVLSLQNLLPTQHGFSNIRQDTSIQGRASENLTALFMIEQSPLVGVGLNNFPILYQDYTKTLGLAPTATQRSAHNLYLEVAAETGIIGLAAFLAIVVLSFDSLLKARRRFLQAGRSSLADLTTGLLAAFTGYMIAAVFIHGAYPRFFYVLVGLAFALRVLPARTPDVDQEISIPQDSALRSDL